MSDREVVLCLNSGSSSLKFALFSMSNESEREIARGAVERIGAGAASWIQVGQSRIERREEVRDAFEALAIASALIEEAQLPAASIAAHRVVHGGPHLFEPCLIDSNVMRTLHEVVPLAPLHMPFAIAGIEGMRTQRPTLPEVACFDTAFHRTMPEVARRLPLPDRFDRDGIRRYGFHGLSYEFVVTSLRPNIPSRAVIAHLGNGASLVALKDGKSIDTTMGLTPTGGIMMGTRSGDLDPGVLFHLMNAKALAAHDVEELVEHEAGLTAVGGASDMKSLLERRVSDPRARLAVEMFGYAVRKSIGSFVAALGGIDLLVFTGGIGERAAEVRAEICAPLSCLGIEIDEDRNAHHDDVISREGGRCEVRVVRTDEDLVMARHAHRLARRLG